RVLRGAVGGEVGRADRRSVALELDLVGGPLGEEHGSGGAGGFREFASQPVAVAQAGIVTADHGGLILHNVARKMGINHMKTKMAPYRGMTAPRLRRNAHPGISPP